MVPPPAVLTTEETATVSKVNVAVADLTASIETGQVPVVLVQAPNQPAKLEPVLAEAVSVTAVLEEYFSEQSVPQSIPATSEVMVPEPVPDLVAVRVKDCGFTIICTSLFGELMAFENVPLLSVAIKR